MIEQFVERYDLSADDVIKAISVDEHGRRHMARVELGQISIDPADTGAREQIAHLKSHIDFATRKEASGRWLPSVRRRLARLKQIYTDQLLATINDQKRDAETRPAAFLSELIKHLDTDIAVLKRKHSEAQTTLARLTEQLRPLQQEIENAINPKSGGPIWTRVLDMVTSLVQTVGRSVGLVGKVMTAERLVNDREEYACMMDLISAALGLLQELRGKAQEELDQLRQLQQRLETAQANLDRQRTMAQTRLAKHPYAQVDVTNLRQAEFISARVTVDLSPGDLARYLEMDEQKLREAFYAVSLTQAHRHTSALGLTDIMEMEAAELSQANAPSRNNDLVVATIQMAYEHAGRDTLQLKPTALPRDWWLVGVPDETNPAFNFGGVSLVSTKRRDQFLFLRVRTGLSLSDLAGLEGMSSAFEQAAKRRNYFVLDALVADDRSRHLFALGLATGVIHISGGGFAVADAQNDHVLGSTVESALEYFETHDELYSVIDEQMHRIPLNDLCALLEGYLERGQGHIDDQGNSSLLWREMAAHIDDHLSVVYEQMRFAANIGANGTGKVK